MPENPPEPIEPDILDDEIKRKSSVVKPSSRRVFLDPSTPPIRSILRVVIVVLVILAVANFVQNIISSLTFLLFIIVLSVFFAYFIEPLIRLIQAPFERKTGKFLPRPIAIVTAYLLIFGGISIAIYTLAPIVVQQAQELGASLPGYSSSIQNQTAALERFLRRYRIPPEMQKNITDKLSSSVLEIGNSVTAYVGETVISIVTFLPWLVLIPILAFFFLKDANLYRVSLLRVFPTGNWRTRIEEILTEVNATLRAYVRAQLISCVLIGIVCTIVFYLLGLNYALLLGVLAGIFEFVPLIGPLTLAILAITVTGFSNSVSQAVYVGIFLLVLRIFHDYVSYPRIVRGGIHLHPLAIILSVLAGEQVAGIPGVFLSIPIVAIATVLYKHFLEYSGSTGILSGLLEPKKEEVSARLVEDKDVPPEKIEEKLEVREEKKQEVKEVVKDAVKEIKKDSLKE